MPSKSKSQQRFMGMVRAAQKGEKPASAKVAKVAKSIDRDDAEDFASTKHKGLPNRMKQETKVRSLIRKMVREIMREGAGGMGPAKKGKVLDMGKDGNNYLIKIGSKKMYVFPDDIVKEGKLTEKAKRDYKAEYKKYGSSTKAKKYRAELNKYNRKKRNIRKW